MIRFELDYGEKALAITAAIITALAIAALTWRLIEDNRKVTVCRTTIEITYVDGGKDFVAYVSEPGMRPSLAHSRGGCFIHLPGGRLILNVTRYMVCKVDTIERNIRHKDFVNKYF